MEEKEVITTKNKKVSPWVFAFIFVLVLLVGVIVYIYLNRNNLTRVDELTYEENEQIIDNQPNEGSLVEETEIIEPEQEPENIQDENGVERADIDEDLKSFDSLDFSGIEDDYRDNAISDLEE